MRKVNKNIFSQGRTRILAATLLNVDRWWYLSELARSLKLRPSSLQRELKTLIELEILKTKNIGKQILFSANTEHILFYELRGIIIKSEKFMEPIRKCFEHWKEKIEFIFIFGSIVGNNQSNNSDIDLMIVGDIKLSDFATALKRTERTLNREINPSIYSLSNFKSRISNKDHFITQVLKNKKIFLIGNEKEIKEIITGEQIKAS